MNDDASLLRRYAEEGSEDAFAELVRRHVDLVFAAAMRRTGGDSHGAADVTQTVFTTLARQAGKLSRHTVLIAWLHTATRNAALNLMISEQRRKLRESHALDIASAQSTSAEPAWERLRPEIDAAIDQLPEADRAAVILRFLERRSYAAIGATLQLSEDAARMRTDRALEKLRVALGRRGITSTSAAIAAVVVAQPVISAPAGFAALVASKSILAATTTTGVSLLSIIMSTSTLATASLTALLAFGAGAYVGLSQNADPSPPPPLETPRHSQMIASLRSDNLSLQAQVARLNADVSRLQTANSQLSAPREAAPSTAASSTTELERSSKQKATLNNLRQIAAARDQFILEHGRPPTSVDELVGETKYIRRLIPVDGENYSGLSMLPTQPLVVVTASGTTVTYDPAERKVEVVESDPALQRLKEMSQRLQPAIKHAITAYRAANNNQPASPDALIPYFATPQEGADFVELLEAQKAIAKK